MGRKKRVEGGKKKSVKGRTDIGGKRRLGFQPYDSGVYPVHAEGCLLAHYPCVEQGPSVVERDVVGGLVPRHVQWPLSQGNLLHNEHATFFPVLGR